MKEITENGDRNCTKTKGMLTQGHQLGASPEGGLSQDGDGIMVTCSVSKVRETVKI